MTQCRLAALAVACVVLPLRANEPTPEQAEFFTKHVAPVLKANCFQCHSHDAKKSKGGLVVDSRDSVVKGGDSGPAVVPGKPADSLLVQAVNYDGDLQMPPKAKLPEADIATLKKWVEMGAPWPGSGTAKKAARLRGVITDEDRAWWAFQPVRDVTPPTVSDPAWNANPVDRFVRAKLDAAKVAPAPPASRAALGRRLSFDLTGLPPVPEDLDAFVRDQAPDAYERFVDKLLASPQYGEAWARHWLDLVRYAESDGYKLDEYRPNAWRYRDYVIKSANDDKPYDRFVKEQLAGDELYPGDPEALAGSNYLWLGIYEYNNRDARTQLNTILNDITDTTADAFLGLGYGCARCHDHKFDPILQKDYYRLQAFFAGLVPGGESPLATPAQLAEYREKLAAWEAKTADIRAKIAKLEEPARKAAEKDAMSKFPPDVQELIKKPVAERTPLEHQVATLAYRQIQYEFDHIDKKLKEPAKSEVLKLTKQLAAFDAIKPKPLPTLMTGGDVGREAGTVVIPKKGNAEPVAPGFLTLLDPTDARVTPRVNSTGRRAALAEWLTRPDNPLTARVIVNRVWQQHFGKGLAANASDLGRLGELPSHPELLDYLAKDFVRGGWKLKPLHRLIVTSQAYRQASQVPKSADPENRLVGRMPTRRVEAEMVRDAILSVTGKLDPTGGGPAVDANKPRRSVYVRAARNVREPLFEVFDLPDQFASSADRHVTTTPTQALYLFNGPQMQHHAKAFAERIAKDEPSDDDARMDRAWRLAFGRVPTEGERTAATAFLASRAKSAHPIAREDAQAAELQYGKVPYRDGRAVLVPAGAAPKLRVPDSDKLPAADFTIEAFVVLRSTYDDATVRLIASHGSDKTGGWAFGVTSRKSANQPQTVVLQLWGTGADGQATYEPQFSGLHVGLNKPYFVAAAVTLAKDGKPGSVSFHVKDMANDDEPMQSATLATKLTALPAKGRGPLCLGSVDGPKSRSWDGLIDDVRLSRGALATEKLLLNSDGVTNATAGYWQFEAAGPMKDATSHRLDLTLETAKPVKTTPPTKEEAAAAAWADLCHVLLNANEFLYVD
ncbi:MAG: DUF1553 domain-containing protein [Gemmataceae bacterium]